MPDDAARPDPRADNPGGADAEPGRRRGRRAARPRNAAALILWRDTPAGPEMLMGRRHAKSRFMPNVLVFPGGAVDRADHYAKPLTPLPEATRIALERKATPSLARAIAVAAVRELYEETGLVLGERQGAGLAPDLACIGYLCRAVTPAASPIRFNARFLLAPAERVQGDIAGSDELDGIGWYTRDAAHADALAPITALVMKEFLGWHCLVPSARVSHPMALFQGLDGKTVEHSSVGAQAAARPVTSR
ncbi:NUDIX hydrolase [Plastoroseomonas hellenica]|uniref:NUDIX hydrolase n=1 Tax=Plastoroseomonas hellenica TaxID=2687306 RepID=UPI001FE374F9|nr:NUDIX domain-containing protein [Plastoroseomonas hellenica]